MSEVLKVNNKIFRCGVLNLLQTENRYTIRISIKTTSVCFCVIPVHCSHLPIYLCLFVFDFRKCIYLPIYLCNYMNVCWAENSLIRCLGQFIWRSNNFKN